MSTPHHPEGERELADHIGTMPPGTRVTHAYTGAWEGTIVRINGDTPRRRKPLYRWTATVRWDGLDKPKTHALALLRPAPITTTEGQDS